MKTSQLSDCIKCDLPKIHNPAGNITSVNNLQDVPFTIKRVYYLYDVPGGEERGGHAHKQLRQLIVAASGSFDVILDDGKNKKSYSLSRPYMGLLLPSGIWRELVNFSSGAICLVLASENYSEEDYIREYDQFLLYKTV
jgi:hypothetical protein